MLVGTHLRSSVRRVSGLPRLVAVIGLTASGLAGCGAEHEQTNSGDVTQAEYRQAAEDVRRCVAGAGFKVTELAPSLDGLLLNFGIETVDGESAETGLAEIDRCAQELGFDSLEKAYYLSQVPTGSEREAEFSRFLACMADVGVDTSGLTSATPEEKVVAAAVDVDPGQENGLQCMDQFNYLFTDGLFPGVD